MSNSVPVKMRHRLLNSDLAGVIFGCNNHTIEECIDGKVFGLPINHLCYIQNVKPGMPIFLFNYSSREMHGVYRAISKGRVNINPHAWTKEDSKKKTPFPAQVEVEVLTDRKPLKEYEFKEAIRENYTNPVIFKFELDQQQVHRLCELFDTSLTPQLPDPKPLPLSPPPPEEEPQSSSVGGRYSKYSRRFGKQSSKDRTLLEEDGLICSAARPRTVAEANGLVISRNNPRESPKRTAITIGSSNNNRVRNVLRKFLEKQDSQNTAPFLDRNQDALCLFGGIDAEQYFYRMEFFHEENWIDGTYLPVISFLDGQAVSLGRNLYIFGGETEDLIQTSTPVNLLKEGEKTWKTVSSLHSLRTLFGAGTFYNGMLVAGGLSHNTDLKSCEFYNDVQDRWIQAPNLNYRRSGLGICSDDQILYASGGSQEGQVMDSVEMLDPRMDRWQLLPHMEDPRRFHGTAVLQGKLWVLGGENRTCDYISTVEIYDPRNQCWSQQTPLTHAKAHLTAEVLQQQIHAIGGSLSPTESSFHYLEKYSTLTESWESGSPLGRSGNRAHHASCVLQGLL